MLRKIVYFSLSFFVFAMFSNGCKGKMKTVGGTLNIHESADPDMLNPINLSSANARRLADIMFSTMLGQEPAGNFDLKPYLLKERAKITEITEGEFAGGMKLEMEIKEDAKWDNGTPITGHDYVFTVKAILNPKTNCENLKGYFDWVGDIVVDSANPKKITIYSNKKHFQIEENAGGYVIPEYNYDAEQIMRKFAMRDFNTKDKINALKTNQDIIKFATQFNSEKFQRDPKFIVGSGPYMLEKWTTGQEVVLKRKENWWGDKYASERDFWAFPKRIKVKIINDNNTAFTALKDGQLDNYCAIPAKDFKELEKNDKFLQNFNLNKVDRLTYSFIGLNTRNEKLKDVNVRKALAHAVNRDKINEILAFGESKKTESFVHNTQPHYNKDLKEYEFNINKSIELLEASGWKDTDGDGIRDKVLNGRKTPLEITFKYSKDENTKNQALIIQEDFKKAGIKLLMVEKEWTVFLQDLDKFDFEMYPVGFTMSPTMSNPKQQWHTSSAVPGGSNNVGWGNAASDQLIEDIISDLNVDSRRDKYKKLQKMIHDDVPVIFMYNSINRIATKKTFNVEKIMISPGVRYNEFELVK
jgi:peptide/nickel transport system substrate-binding protein